MPLPAIGAKNVRVWGVPQHNFITHICNKRVRGIHRYQNRHNQLCKNLPNKDDNDNRIRTRTLKDI